MVIGIQPVQNEIVACSETDVTAASDKRNFGEVFFYMLNRSVCGAVIDNVEAEGSFGVFEK